MKRKLALALAATVCSASGLLAQDVHQDLSYGPGERNVLDLFLPQGVEHPPLVMYIHGGAWFRGDKAQVEEYDRRKRMNEAGIAVATINHTWSQQATWPAQKDDVVAAIRFLQENAGTYGYDMSRFAVWGQSSGAHLALWSAVLAAEDDSLGIDAVVSWCAPSNLYMLWHDRLADDVPGGNEKERLPSPETNLIGVDAQQDKPAADAVSPDIQAAKLPPEAALPPILLVHGDADPRVSPLQSKRVLDVLSGRGSDAELIIVEGGGHGGDPFNAAVQPSLDFIIGRFRADGAS
ncbi:alpha/beta hydrolase [Tropicimonas sediminicola]|uniref:Acetyl esterase/lipase n=1 Tax=Tropicimonas sediminicola TaxID=1031541 RepID=A0A239FCF2_9RHOB|nr:alpha/beta hydrolase [Tropicimonas sediminicola]SNS54411.1 Acetyl esterase/lipase [Tropicimonas sediminicola]